MKQRRPKRLSERDAEVAESKCAPHLWNARYGEPLPIGMIVPCPNFAASAGADASGSGIKP